MPPELPASNLNRELEEAGSIRRFAYSFLEGEHKGDFRREDYIALILFNRCLQTHEATEILVRHSLIDDAWALIRALAEHAVNCAYMLMVADAQIANDFSDYPKYRRYKELLYLKKTNEDLLRKTVTAEQEETMRTQFEAVRSRFDGKHGDRWCPDEKLYKRAARVDERITEAAGEKRDDFQWLVNFVWGHVSAYVHGAANVLAQQVTGIADGVRIQRKYTFEEAAQALFSANLALYVALLPVDQLLGGKNVEELKGRFAEWSARSLGC